jgi:hypothetical protein
MDAAEPATIGTEKDDEAWGIASIMDDAACRRPARPVQLLAAPVQLKGEIVSKAYFLLLPVVFVAVAASAGQKNAKEAAPDPKRPKLTLKAQPVIAIAPARVVLTAELQGGPNDYEEFYCPSIEWDWGDGTQSESTSDCAPYEAGKSEIKRRYTVEHQFRAGTYRVAFKLKRREKVLTLTSITVQVRPGLRDIGQ